MKKIDLEVIGSIPRDDSVIIADMDGKALVDYPDSIALRSIDKIAENILN